MEIGDDYNKSVIKTENNFNKEDVNKVMKRL